MSLELELFRAPSFKGATLGWLLADGEQFCRTLEDQIREVRGQPVASWKVPKATAIPAGRYRVTLEHSARFGPDCPTINDVPGFSAIRIHGGNDADDTEGCVLVGDQVGDDGCSISGGKLRGVLARLREMVRSRLSAGAECWITIRNPEPHGFEDGAMG